jgi:LysR family transcriptional regulator, glycine cleavage system transcriptional activator
MRDLPLHALRAFASVYLHGGVRAAARELGIAHSSVSRHVAELEKWLGVKLTRAGVDRRRLAFTPQGEALGKTTLASLGEIAHAVAALREARSSQSVTISAAPSFAVRWLLPRLPAFEQAFPRLEISVMVDRRLDDPEAGGIDLAIRMGRGPWPDLHCEPLMDDALYPVMSPAYWKKSGRPQEPGDLVGLRLLHDRDPHASWEAWRRAHGPAALDVRRGSRFTSSDLVLRAAAQGQGVALARHRLAQDDLATGALLRPIGGLSVDLGPAYWLVTRHQAPDRPALATVVAWLRREAARQPASA